MHTSFCVGVKLYEWVCVFVGGYGCGCLAFVWCVCVCAREKWRMGVCMKIVSESACIRRDKTSACPLERE